MIEGTIRTSIGMQVIGGEKRSEQVIKLAMGPNVARWRTQLAKQAGGWLRSRMSGVGRLEYKALRLWNSEANGRITGETAARRRGDIATETAELLAVEAVELHFWFPDDLPEEPFELKFAEGKKH